MCGSSRNGALHKPLNPHTRFISSIRDYQVASAIIYHIKKVIKLKNDLITNKICKYCETLDHEDIEILEPSELNGCKCKQCKQMKEVA